MEFEEKEAIRQMTAQEAGTAMSLMSGTVRLPLRSWGIPLLAVFLMLCLLILLGLRAFPLIPFILILGYGGLWRMTTCIRYDGTAGEITHSDLFSRKKTIYLSQIEQIVRSHELDGENKITYTGGRNGHVHVQVAHSLDDVSVVTADDCVRVRLRRSSFGREYKGYGGGDVGAAAYDHFLMLYERSLHPEDDIVPEPVYHRPASEPEISFPTGLAPLGS